MTAPREASGSDPTGSGEALRVLVADDSRLYREGLVHLLSEAVGSEAVRAAESVTELRAQLNDHAPDVVIVNLAARRSHEMLALVLACRPQARTVVVGVDDTDGHQVLECAEAGVSGYVTREYSFGDLMRVVRDVAAIGSHVSPRISAVLLRRVRETASQRIVTGTAFGGLTDRESQILRLIGAGLSNQRIAVELTIELHTVKNHVHSVLTKLGVRSRGEAAALLRDRDERRGELAGTETSVGQAASLVPRQKMNPVLGRRTHASWGGGDAS